jgi:hypothetical protein
MCWDRIRVPHPIAGVVSRSFCGTILESLEVASDPVLYSQEDCDRIGEVPDSAPTTVEM